MTTGAQRNYWKTEKGKKTQRRYHTSPLGKSAMARYKNSPKGKKSNQKYEKKTKTVVLTHYGKGGKLLCCWLGCQVVDLDMLTLDHVYNDGAARRKLGEPTGVNLYRKLRLAVYPTGFKTLCMNHQFKKSLRQRRAKRNA